MLATLVTAVISGLHGELVRVEVDVARACPCATSWACRTPRCRRRVSASGARHPQCRVRLPRSAASRSTSRPPTGASTARRTTSRSRSASSSRRSRCGASGGPWALLGELSLGGTVQPVAGVLPMVATLARPGHRRDRRAGARTSAEARMVADVERRRRRRSRRRRPARRRTARPNRGARPTRRPPLMVSGPRRGRRAIDRRSRCALVPACRRSIWPRCAARHHARWALEVALAGGHNLLMSARPAPARRCWPAAIPGLLAAARRRRGARGRGHPQRGGPVAPAGRARAPAALPSAAPHGQLRGAGRRRPAACRPAR